MKKMGTLFAAALFALWVASPNLTGCKKPPSDFIVNTNVATGSWIIAVEIPACDYEHIKVKLPERQGDVVTLFCDSLPVKVK